MGTKDLSWRRMGAAAGLALAALACGCNQDFSFKSTRQIELASQNAACNPATDSPAFLPIRRLTRIQYNNSLRDVTGFGGDHAAGLPSDTFTEGYAFGQSFSFSHADRMFAVAESLATKLASRVSQEGGILGTGCTTGVTATTAEACARPILAAFAGKAFRRPLAATSPEVSDLVNRVIRPGIGAGDPYEVVMRDALATILISPRFLYRLEIDAAEPRAGSARALTNTEIASRLSFFLWNSVPDPALLAADFQGAGGKAVLAAQVDRMLKDSKSTGFKENFVNSWLKLRDLDPYQPIASLFPEFNETLRASMKTETQLFFDDAIKGDRSVSSLLTSNVTFLNGTMASHYGISPLPGGGNANDFRAVTMPGYSNRVGMGMLGNASIQTVRSHPETGSPVRRGVWMLDRILCSPVGAAPMNVSSDDVEPAPNSSARDRLAAHRLNPRCASCHDRIDPIGLAFENFNAIGKYRVKEFPEDAKEIDASGAYLGKSFVNASGLVQEIAKGQEFPRCFSRHLASYAFSRILDLEVAGDRCVMRQLRPQGDGTLSIQGLIQSIAGSDAFLKRRAGGD